MLEANLQAEPTGRALSADKGEGDGCCKCTSKDETEHVRDKEEGSGSKDKNPSETESGAGEAAAEPSTTKTYFAIRHSGFKHICCHRQAQKWLVQITGVRVTQAHHASLDDAKRMVTRYQPLQPSCKRPRGHRGHSEEKPAKKVRLTETIKMSQKVVVGAGFTTRTKRDRRLESGPKLTGHRALLLAENERGKALLEKGVRTCRSCHLHGFLSLAPSWTIPRAPVSLLS